MAGLLFAGLWPRSCAAARGILLAMNARHAAAPRFVLPTLLLTFLTIAAAAQGRETPAVFDVDFSRWIDPPLVKTKFGVYQTPLVSRDVLLRSLSRLREINVQDFRYELGWGKPDVLEPHQVTGTAAAPRLDFSLTNALVSGLRGAQNVRPLFALTYCPDPLQTRTDWPAWKDLPRDLRAWQTICGAFAAHFRLSRPVPAYEVWNEPDIPETGGKMFFSGGPAEYDRLYEHAAAGVRAGDANAPVGGAAVAYDLRYFVPLLARPLDFASIHAYDNYAAQVAGLRARLDKRPDLPIYLTEYASFTTFGKSAPVSRYPAAARFFRDVTGMLGLPDLVKVYWAQWVDDDLGLITRDGHKKALFNAFKIYGQLPVDRNAVTPTTAPGGVNALASSDEHTAGVVVWNENEEDGKDRTVSVHLRRLPFARGSVQAYRIDKNHASYKDDPAAENLNAERQWNFDAGGTEWTGRVPAGGVVYLKVTDGSGKSLLTPKHVGTLIRMHHWFPDRKTNAYADFDPRTAIARLSMGKQNAGVAQIGVVLENPVRRFLVRVKRTGPFTASDKNALFGLRLDFASRAGGGYGHGVLFHGGLYDTRRGAVLPWGRGGAVPNAARKEAGMSTGKPFLVDLDKIAPPDWDGRRVLISFVLQNAGAGSRARIALTPLQ